MFSQLLLCGFLCEGEHNTKIHFLNTAVLRKIFFHRRQYQLSVDSLSSNGEKRYH